MRMGPDGDPVIEEFGNARSFESSKSPDSISGNREPLTDVFVHNDSIAVTLEIPGVSKDNIKLDASEEKLIIHVDDPKRRYYKEVRLPRKARPGSAKATYNNGVLDITLEIDSAKEPTRVTIE
ncbi:MAG TPA: Hsp20/alpha crystallin family protein [Euryarchaeota archaeon]|nr:Hsp20/alpha crystallin family protein [Euryarchaeota archaeon]